MLVVQAVRTVPPELVVLPVVVVSLVQPAIPALALTLRLLSTAPPALQPCCQSLHSPYRLIGVNW
jgi:hypothetical protein